MVNKKQIQSIVEKVWLEKSGRDLVYPAKEYIGIIEVENFPALGKLTALRFLEWVQQNPEGVISLPTGKTPEHFIKWVQRLLQGWHKPEIQQLLKESGIDPSKKPEMESLHFVQIDEFYPMDSSQHNSFNYYVRHFYIKGFGLDPDKALLIDPMAIGLKPGQKLQAIWPDNRVDLTLRYRQATSDFEQKQKHTSKKWCLGKSSLSSIMRILF